MNFYDLLRFIIDGLSKCKCHPVDPQKIRDSLNLIARLDQNNVFGTMGKGVHGSHIFIPEYDRVTDSYKDYCIMCGRNEATHE